MLQRCSDVNLGEETLGPEDSSELGVNYFHRDLSLVTKIFREIDSGHSALSQLSLDGVFVCDRRSQARQGISHAASRPTRFSLTQSDAAQSHGAILPATALFSHPFSGMVVCVTCRPICAAQNVGVHSILRQQRS